MKRSFKPSALARRISQSSLLFGCLLTLLINYYVNPLFNVMATFPPSLTQSQIVAANVDSQTDERVKETKGEIQKSLEMATHPRIDDLNHRVQSNGHLIEGEVQRNVDKTQGALNQADDCIEVSNQSALDAVKDFFGK